LIRISNFCFICRESNAGLSIRSLLALSWGSEESSVVVKYEVY